jgi:hypothetical protein
MSHRKHILGLFSDEPQAVSVLDEIKRSRFSLEDVYSPIPSQEILDALDRPKSKVGYFTLAGGITGFITGIGLAVYTAVQWNLVVSGKPVVALVPFFIVGFEFTVLFAVFGNIIGFLSQSRLPQFQTPTHYDPRCTGDRFGILASCAKSQVSDLETFFRERGGEVQRFDG